MAPKSKQQKKKKNNKDIIDDDTSKSPGESQPNQENHSDNDDDNKKEETPQNGLKKKDVVLDPEYKVPLSYVKFFKKKVDISTKSNYLIIITISNRKGKKKKTSTIISWNVQDNPFPGLKLSAIESDLAKHYNTTCNQTSTSEENFFTLFGSFVNVKKYLIEKYGIKDDQIRLNFQTDIVPPYFTVKLQTKLGTYITRISWDTTRWTDESYKDFEEEFELKLIDFKLQSKCEKYTDHIEYVIEGYCIKEFEDYFRHAWHMKKDQIKINETPRDKEPYPASDNNNYLIKNPYKEMIDTFSDYPEDSYYYKMFQTIKDAYEIEYHKLDGIEIKANLVFEKTGSESISKQKPKSKSKSKSKSKNSDDDDDDDDENKNDYEEINDLWVTKFDVLSRFSIDGIQTGRFLTEGDIVIVKYCKERAGKIEGTITSNKRGKVTALFRLKQGQIPPGCKIKKEEINKDKEKVDIEEEEEEEEDNEDYYSKNKNKNDGIIIYDDIYNNDDDSDDSNDNKNDDDEEEDSEFNYSISFKPNDVTFQRAALGLLILKSMKSSPIKKIIKKDKFDKSINEIQDIDIPIDKKMNFDKEDLVSLTESEKERISLPLTKSQKLCVEMVLSNYVSIIHGPPGCGKTFSIGLFVYHLIKQSISTNSRILLCAFSHQAVESIVKFVSPVARALNKEILWLPRKSMNFETKEDFTNATEEQKCLSTYKILQRKETEEVFQFKELQNKKWKYENIKNIKNKKHRDHLLSDINNIFTESDQHKMDNIQNKIERNLISESDIVCCTLIASGKSHIKSFNFDYIIIDESSQADQMVSLIPLIHYPEKLILLGDHNQLDANVSNEFRKEHPETSSSLYLKLLKKRIQHRMLKTQFRMNPLICEFPNKAFYNGKIITAKNLEAKTKVVLNSIPTPIMFIDVKYGEEEKVYGITYKNEEEAKVVEILLNNFKMNNIPGNQVGVITPYHEQLEILRDIQRSMKYRGVRISCVDNFQGSERDFIILSMVRTNAEGNFGFITNRNRLNVSLTRARKGLIIVGNFYRLGTRNRSTKHPENEIIIKLCEFYKKEKCVMDSKSLKLLQYPVKNKPEEEENQIIEIDDEYDDIDNNSDKFNEEYDIEDDVDDDYDDNFDEFVLINKIQ